MISKIEIYVQKEDDAQHLAAEMKDRGHDVTGPYYTNGYGAPRNYAGMKDEVSQPLDYPETDYPDGDEG